LTGLFHWSLRYHAPKHVLFWFSNHELRARRGLLPFVCILDNGVTLKSSKSYSFILRPIINNFNEIVSLKTKSQRTCPFSLLFLMQFMAYLSFFAITPFWHSTDYVIQATPWTDMIGISIPCPLCTFIIWSLITHYRYVWY